MEFPRRLVTILLCCSYLPASGPVAGEESGLTLQTERLRQLLARLEGEPLVVFSTLDAGLALEHVTVTAAGRAFADPQYAPQRREAFRLLEEKLGAHPEVIWDALRRHLAGPLALVLAAPPDGVAADRPPMRLVLLAAVKDRGSIEAVKLGWPQVPPDSDTLLGALALQIHPLEELAVAKPVPDWADRCARMIGEIQVMLRPGAMLTAVKALAPNGPKTPEWVKDLEALCPAEVERLELNLLPAGRFFIEELRCELKSDARGILAQLLRSLRADPQSWAALEKVLPGGTDVQFLLQADLKAMGDRFPALLRYFERILRGKRWTNLYGDTEDAMTADRFAFLTRPWAGTFGLVARNGESGETQITGVAAEPGTKATDRRLRLLEGLAGLGLDFETSIQAPTIGSQPPLAAGFKGRGLMPAPMIGLSDSWIWLCSSTAAYHDLVTALAEENNLHRDRKLEGLPRPAGERDIPFPERSAFNLRVNLPSIGPLAYTSWMLGESGQQILGWKVPSGLLPSPGFLKRHLVPYEAQTDRTEREVRFYARGPVPGGALLPLAGLAALSLEMEHMLAAGPEALRRELDSLIGPGIEPGQGDGK